MAGRAPVGLDIGTSCVRGVEASITRGSLRLDKFGQVALPVGAVRDGEVVDVDLVASALRKLWADVRFSTRRVALGVSNQRVVVRQVDLPWMETTELKKSLTYQVADLLPMPIEQAILDFYPVEEYLNDAGARTLRILIVAGARDMIDNALEAVRRAGLKATSVDLTPFALIRAVVSHDHLGMVSEAEAIVDIGARVTNIAVHQGGVPRFVRILLMGGADITDSIAERLGVPVDQAERLKYDLGVPLNPAERDAHPASRAIESAAASFVDEVRGSLDYYLASPGAVSIRRVVLTGGGSRLRNLPQRLAFATRLPVDVANPFSTVRIGRTGLSQEQLAYIQPLVPVPMGLAVGGLS
ncbi:MAG: type IV pilus assembly protein PilM [Acidothermus sp.]|nr:type IV pilus assembly protein PilM [Acidothermus sp.]